MMFGDSFGVLISFIQLHKINGNNGILNLFIVFTVIMKCYPKFLNFIITCFEMYQLTTTLAKLLICSCFQTFALGACHLEV